MAERTSLWLSEVEANAASAERAILFGRAWGSKIAMLTNAGHIKVCSGHTTWEAGFRYLYQLQQLISARSAFASARNDDNKRSLVDGKGGSHFIPATNNSTNPARNAVIACAFVAVAADGRRDYQRC